MNRIPFHKLLTSLLALIILLACVGQSLIAQEFNIRYTADLSESPISGRLVLLLSPDTTRDPNYPSPVDPFITFGMNFENWHSGEKLILNQTNSDNFPSTMEELGGDYSLRAFVDLDSTSCSFLKDGTLYSEKMVCRIKAGADSKVEVKVSKVFSTDGFTESEEIKSLRLQSKLLSDFYQGPTFIEAAVILPESYAAEPRRNYPVVYVFPGWGATHVAPSHPTYGKYQLERYGMRGFGKEKIFVFLNQDSRYGYHVFADSENNGPRATSFIEEFIPFLESRFRVSTKPGERFLAGQSSGAWASLWLMVNYPDHFALAWAGSPDPVDFRDFTGRNLYADGASFFASAADKDWSDMETTLSEGGQNQSFEAVFGRKGKDNRPEQVYDRSTGDIFPEALEHWKKYDINLFIRENRELLGDKLAGKIHIAVADDDDYKLDGAVKLLKSSLEELGIPANIMLMPDGGHNTWTEENRTKMHQVMDQCL